MALPPEVVEEVAAATLAVALASLHGISHLKAPKTQVLEAAVVPALYALDRLSHKVFLPALVALLLSSLAEHVLFSALVLLLLRKYFSRLFSFLLTCTHTL
jgi:hypothetical protein